MTDTPARLAAAIARALHHGCAVDDDDVTRETTITELATLFEEKASRVDAQSGGPACVRWKMTQEGDLCHETGSKRLWVAVNDGGAAVSVYAGNGEAVCMFTYDFEQQPGERPDKVTIRGVRADLLVDRADRVELLTNRCFHALFSTVRANFFAEVPDAGVLALAEALRICLVRAAEYRYRNALDYANMMLSRPPPVSCDSDQEEELPPIEPIHENL